MSDLHGHHEYAGGVLIPASGNNAEGRLTRRQVQVMAVVATGAKNKKNADIMQISERTVQTHISNVMARLGVDSRLRCVYLLGWVQIP